METIENIMTKRIGFACKYMHPDQTQKKKLLESIGKEAYNGVDLFEGTTPLKRGGNPSSGGASQGPFQGVDPSDPGVDIGSLTESLGGVWKKLAKGGKK